MTSLVFLVVLTVCDEAVVQSLPNLTPAPSLHPFPSAPSYKYSPLAVIKDMDNTVEKVKVVKRPLINFSDNDMDLFNRNAILTAA